MRAQKGNDMTKTISAARIVGAALGLCVGTVAQAETYAYGGVTIGKADYEYTYTPDTTNNVTEFSHTGAGVFLGIGRTFGQRGNMSYGGEADLAFGAWESDLEKGTTTPCLASSQGCIGKIGTLATFRGVLAWDAGGFSPFITGGLATARVKGSADLGACNFVGSCEYGDTQTGWVVGVGFTRRLTDKYDLRVDYLYADLGEPEFTDPVRVTGDSIVFQQLRIGAQMNF